MKPIAIVGAGGYVGSRLIERSELTGEMELVPIVRSWRSQGRLARYGFRTVQASAGDTASLVPLLKDCGMAVNLTMGDDKCIVTDVQSIHRACREAGVPLFVHMSSAEVFGRAEAPDIREDSVPDGEHWMEYGREKAAAEQWLWQQSSGPVSTVILRPGLIWGPGSGWLAGPAQALADGTAYLFNDGRGICNLIHVDNLIQHLVALSRSKGVESGFFNISDIETHSWADYYAAIAREIGVDERTIHLLEDSAIEKSFMQKVLDLRQSAPAMAIKRRIPADTRTRVKQRLKDRLKPPIRVAQPFEPAPVVSKEMWWVQGTARRLPSSAFKQRFPELQLRPFPELMSAAGRWLRYAGFDGS
nr:NAD(P)-dependent oxidoreductase [Mycolicibacterium komanii]CRL69222.1 dehydrogenase [Mycolicibacterium komanii]